MIPRDLTPLIRLGEIRVSNEATLTLLDVLDVSDVIHVLPYRIIENS